MERDAHAETGVVGAALDEALAERLGAWLSDVEQRSVAVERFALVSAGARRVNALFDLVDGSDMSRLALTLNQSASIEILPVAAEAQVRALAEEAGVPVPHGHHVCERTDVLGGPFFISTAIDGVSVPRHVMRLVRERSIGTQMVRQLGAAMADLHAVDAHLAPAEVPRPSGDGPVADSLVKLDEQMTLQRHPSPSFALAARWLEQHAPPKPERVGIVHGDIRVGNVIVDDSGIAAILDWETCHVGDPLEDLAWSTLRMWRFREDALRVGGLGSIDTLRKAYEGSGGDWDAARFEWWRLLSTVRWGVAMAGQARSHLDGSHRSIVMAASGRRVTELEYDTLMLLNPDRIE